MWVCVCVFAHWWKKLIGKGVGCLINFSKLYLVWNELYRRLTDSFLQLHNTSVSYVRPDRIIGNSNYQLMVDADPNLSIVRCDFQTLRQFSQCEHPSQAFSSVSSWCRVCLHLLFVYTPIRAFRDENSWEELLFKLLNWDWK